MTGRAIRALAVLGAVLVTAASLPRVVAAQTELRPDLTPFAASELAVVIDSVTGNPKLVFAAVSWNRGTGPMELRGGEVLQRTKQNVYQRVYLSDGTYYDRLAGTFEWHESHNHFHFEGYALYTLQPVNAPGGSQRQGSKTSFCLLDTNKVDLTLPGAPQTAVYVTCNPDVQGISVGWGDRYGPTLPGQSLDLTNEPNGDYDLSIQVDPQGRLLESNENNNTSCVRLRISVTNRTVQVLGGCSSTPGVTVSAISPNSMSAGTSVEVTITGSGFGSGMAVGFENGSGPEPVVSNVRYDSSTTIRAFVTVKSGGPRGARVWDVRVGGGVLPGGFTVIR